MGSRKASGRVKMTQLSCRFRANEVRLWLSVIAYNLGNLWRRLALPTGIGNWSLTSLQQRLVKTGGRLIKHVRYYWLLLAESQLTRRLFGAMPQEDCYAAGASGIGSPLSGADFGDEIGREEDKCVIIPSETRRFPGFYFSMSRTGSVAAP
jgi:hypothetical protein